MSRPAAGPALAIAIALLVAGCSRDSAAPRAARDGGAKPVEPPPAAPIVSVSVVDTENPGAAAMEREVAIPLEDALARVPALTHLRSVSTSGQVRLLCTFQPATGAIVAVAAIQAATSAVRLPPTISPTVVSRTASTRVRFVAASSRLSQQQMASMRDRIIRPAFERMRGVTSVFTCGGGRQVVRVVLDSDRLAARQLDVAAIRSGLSRTALGGKFRSLDDLASAAIPGAAGPVTLRDVAVIERGSTQPACSAHADGGAVLSIDVGVTGDGALEQVAARTIAVEAGILAARLPAGVSLTSFAASAPATLELWLEPPPGVEPEPLHRLGASAAATLAPAPGVVAVLVESGDLEGATETLDGPGVRALVALDQAGAAAGVIAAASRMPDLAVHVVAGPMAEARIQVLGDDLESLDRAAAEIAAELGKARGIAAAGVVSAGQLPRVLVEPDPARLAALGMAADDVGAAVAVALKGARVADLDEAGDRIPIRLELDGPQRDPAEMLSRLRLRGSTGTMVPVSSVAVVKLAAEPARILRVDRRRAVEVWIRPAAALEPSLAEARRALAAPPAGIEVVWP